MSDKSTITDSGNDLFDPDAELQALFQRTALEATSVDIDALRVAADSRSVDQLSKPIQSYFHWRALMSNRSLVTVTIVAILFLLIFSKIPFEHSSGVAWAEVKDKIEKARTIQFVSTEYPPGDRTKARHVTQYMIRGRHLQRIENDDKVSKNSTISIEDAKRGKRVMINPDSKLFIVFKTLVTVKQDSGKDLNLESASKTESEMKSPPEVDFYNHTRKMLLPSENMVKERLPEKTIDGKKLIGFRIVEKFIQGRLIRTMTYWVDPKTKLPIRIEGTFRGNPMADSDVIIVSDFVISDFILDQKLDDSLFSFEPPEGYTVEERRLYSAKSDSDESDSPEPRKQQIE